MKVYGPDKNENPAIEIMWDFECSYQAEGEYGDAATGLGAWVETGTSTNALWMWQPDKDSSVPSPEAPFVHFDITLTGGVLDGRRLIFEGQARGMYRYGVEGCSYVLHGFDVAEDGSGEVVDLVKTGIKLHVSDTASGLVGHILMPGCRAD